MAELDDPRRISLIGRAYYEPTLDPILNTLLERALRLASTPMAMVSIVGAHAQVFRAHRGLPPELAVACGTSRSSSFCQLVVRSEHALVVTDAATDPRVPPELVTAYGFRAYAGAPIRRGAVVLGSLCVVDVVPRSFPEAVPDGLHQIADQVSSYLDKVSRREWTLPAAGAVTARDIRVRVESLLAALSIVEPTARRNQFLRAQDVTSGALVAIRGTLGELLAFHDEVVRVARDLKAFTTQLDRGDEDILRHVDDIQRTLGEVSVMTRVARAFLREELDAERAARALGVARDVLSALDALVGASRALLRALETRRAASVRIEA